MLDLLNGNWETISMDKALFPDIERFSEMAFYVFKSDLDQNKTELKERYNHARTENLAIIKKIEEIIIYADKKGWKSQTTIWNVAGFITLISLDLKLIMEEMVFYIDNEWKENFLIRSLCVLLYEAVEDIPTVMRKSFYNYLIKYDLDKGIMDLLFDKKKSISDFGKKYSEDLRIVRKYVGAHRDHNFMEQMSIIKDLDISTFLQLAIEFEKLVNELGQVQQKIINITAELYVKNDGIYDK